MPVDPTRLKSLWKTALSFNSPADRSTFLDRECGDDAELRATVEAMLAADTKLAAEPDETAEAPAPKSSGETNVTRTFGEEILGRSESDTRDYVPTPQRSTIPRSSTDRSDSHVRSHKLIADRYRLIELLGEGGMGAVYRADQLQPVKRQVALKLIRAGMDSRTVLARFEAERQALAMMDHPNIARVYDGGETEERQPFFVMELVDGKPITTYCDAKRLTLRARLELFVAVCQAVQHAHQKGIIHRDLKPGNVLVAEVDGRPTPKVIDFGVAKSLECDLTDQSFGDTDAIVGTPAYMSPEQADPTSMDIDTRTDVYALGVILYELLVGSPPIDTKQFKRGAFLEILRMVREIDPPRPSTKLSTAENLPNIAANRNIEPSALARSLRGELDWVVMKALEKDRNRRYESASGFARDLERFLADEVVEARPPSRGYRVRKFVRRNKGKVIAVSVVMITLVAGVIGTSLAMFEAQRQKEYAVKGWSNATDEKNRAEKNLETARGLILNMGNQLAQGETFQKDQRVADLARKQALDQARSEFEKFRVSVPNDSEVQVRAGELHLYAANLSRGLADYASAAEAYDTAQTIFEDLVKQSPENGSYRYRLSQVLTQKSTFERLVGKLTLAAKSLARAFDLMETTRGQIAESSYLRSSGLVAIEQSHIAYLLGQAKDSARFAERARDMLRELLDPSKTNSGREQSIMDPYYFAQALNRLAIAQRELNETTRSLQTHDEAVAQMAKLSTSPDTNRDFIFMDCEVRRERARTGAIVPERRPALVADLQKVGVISQKLVEDYPYVAFYRERLAITQMLLGTLLTLRGELEPAASELSKSLAVSRVLIDRFTATSAHMLVRAQTFLALGKTNVRAGKLPEARVNFANSAKVFQLALTVDPENSLHRLGQAEAVHELKKVSN